MMQGLLISYDLGDFGAVNYINVTPHDAKEQGHWFHQIMPDGSLEWIGGFGKTTDRNASYCLLVRNGPDGMPDWSHTAYGWLDDEYAWWGTSDETPVTFGCRDLEQLRLLPNGGLFLGDGEEVEHGGIGRCEFGMFKADATTDAPGENRGKTAFIDDPDNPGKMMYVAYFGESAVPVVLGREP